MKKLIFTIISICILGLTVHAAPGYEPGITGDITTNKNEYKYKETIFLTGEPITMEGTVEIRESSNGSKTTVEYNLYNAQKSAELTRKMVFNNTKSSDEAGTQTTYSTTVDPKFTEEITIGSDTFELREYLFSRSGITDDRDIIRYINSDWNGRKVYSRNEDQGEVIIDINSHLYGYSNYWSSTETAICKYLITYRYKDTVSSAAFKEENGSVEYAVSNSSLKTIQYMTNGPQYMSYAGGYVIREGEENVVSYIYELPKLVGGKPTGSRNKGKDSYKLVTVPIQTRLMANNIKDVYSSYWAAEDIKRVTALGIIEISGTDYFRPLSFISRGEFAKAVIKVSDISSANTKKTRYRSFEQYYTDVDKNHPYYEYINRIADSGIMEGSSKNRFAPNEYLTKAQAAAILVRALGLEGSSTESSTTTTFRDDAAIQLWAKKPLNIAHSMGIITSNENNEIQPDKILTRAECAVMINRFIGYLQYDIRQGYREDMINFGR